MLKIGQGYDVHQLKSGLPLILGGVEIEHAKGIAGHSDADILIHAIIDAILGAFNMGDIGAMFPNDEKWLNATGLNMLLHMKEKIKSKVNKMNIINIDSTIILQAPKLQSYILQMKQNIANALEISPDSISIKATTTDHLGFIGKEEGIGCIAICLVNHE
tara:strand:+ start:36894 stop:37373 length:480 start_codon:yes stop_codon:yes gene_type:complete